MLNNAERAYYYALTWVREMDRRLTEGSIHIRDTSGQLITNLTDLIVAIEVGTVELK
jgi:hypothetical protein